MQRAGLGISTHVRSPSQAAQDAIVAALEPLEGAAPDLMLLAVTSAWGREGVASAVDAAAKAFDRDLTIGATVEGLAGGGVEVFRNPGVAALAIAGVEVEPFACAELVGREEELGERILSELSRAPGPDDLVLLFLDSLGALPGPALASLPGALGSGALIGLGAAPLPMDGALVWHAGEIARGACAGVVLRGPRPPTLRVTHGFTAIGEPHRVTRARGHWIHELDGRPALEVYIEALPASVREDPEWASRHALLVGLCGNAIAEGGREATHARPGEQLLIRNVAGIDREQGAISVPEPVELGRRIAFVLRDPEAARRDLERQLVGIDAGAIRFGCHLSCSTRGAEFFGALEGEAAQLQRALPDVPLLGMLGAYQLFASNIAEGPDLLTHSAVLALLEG